MKSSIIEKAWSYIKDSVDNKIIKFILPKIKCEICEVKNAKWKHNYLDSYVCDECVPRGCSCKIVRNTKRATFLSQYEYKTDKKGRELPCEDWNKFQ